MREKRYQNTTKKKELRKEKEKEPQTRSASVKI